MTDDEWNEECGYCGEMTEYDGGIIRINDKPCCRDCLDEVVE